MLKKIEDMNYYELLEVSPRATSQEIHKAYERVRRIYDPNSIALYSLFSPEETEKIRQRIEEAYRTLIYEENRRTYDLNLGDYIRAATPEPPIFRPVAPSPPPAASAAPSPSPSRAEPAPPPPPARIDEPRAVPHAPETPQVPTTLQPLPADIPEVTGLILRMLREQRKLTVQNVADVTKLSTRYIEGIEAEQFVKLPVRPYLRGFLVLLAKALGYEPDRIANDYLKRYDAAMNLQKQKK